MKNLINYYYNLSIKKIKKINDSFFFEFGNKNYEFTPFYGDINKFYEIYLTLSNNKNYCHEIILNRNQNLITFYNNKAYLLLKKNICIDKRVDIEEIMNYGILVYKGSSFNWKNLWKDKIDYYEYQMSQLSLKYKILKKSFDYYIGLSETAISLLNFVNEKDIKYYICHKRITPNQNLDDFFNPINIIIDNRTRDIAEYIKINYLNENIKMNEVTKYLDLIDLDDVEVLLLLSRLLYPSYYFDLYDQIIQEKVSEEKINFYIKRNTLYEVFLKKIYNFLKLKYNGVIPEIEWLEF